MADLDLLHFEQLKAEIQSKYLETHTPSDEKISNWKGIDIIYFQEELRKSAKGNISEKSFYTYFKSSPATKLPRIDILNILSIYAGYTSWYDFKKNHLFANEILRENEDLDQFETEKSILNTEIKVENQNFPKITEKPSILSESKPILQNNTSENQWIDENKNNTSSLEKSSSLNFVKKYLWLGISGILAIFVGLLGFKEEIFSKKFYYSFIDADRNSKINAELQVQILQENETPILYVAKPNEPFVYTTKSKTLTMVVSSPYYKTDTIRRNLETAQEAENIELKPNDYAIMLFYYSKSLKDLKKKRSTLNYLISDDALIYQVFDSDDYGMETMDKQRYISYVTLPTTSLEKLEVIETKNNKAGKINMIKFKIASDVENQ